MSIETQILEAMEALLYAAEIQSPSEDSYCRATTESAVRKAKAVKARIDAAKEAERKRTAEAWIEEQTRAKGIDFRAMADALTDILTRSEQSAKTFPNAPGHGDHIANASAAKRALKAVAASNPEAAPLAGQSAGKRNQTKTGKP